jgi:hypothetical protein
VTRLSQNDSTVEIELEIEEGAFSSGYGPGWQRGTGQAVSGGGGGASLGAMLDWLFKQKRKKKKDRKAKVYLVPKVMSVLDLLKLLRALR